MSKYVDGFVIPIQKSRVADYRKIAKKACKVWMDHGALAYFECVGEELEPKGMPGGMQTFPKLARSKTDETVVFAWILYKSKAHRSAVNKKVMADKRITNGPKEMPFDMMRMSVGGFSVIVQS
jgi:alkaline phosphatase